MMRKARFQQGGLSAVSRNRQQERMNARRARIGMEPYVPQTPTQTPGQTAADWLSTLSLATTPVAGVSDVAGLLADAAMYATRPEERTLGNAALTLAGLAPLVPAASALRAGKNAAEGALDMSQTARMQRAAEQGYVPETVYHGTAKDIDVFDPQQFGGSATNARSARMGVWLADDPYVAETYARHAAEDVPVKKLLQQADRAAAARNFDEQERLYEQAAQLERDLVGGGGQNIIPARIRGNLFEIDADGASLSDLDESQLFKWSEEAKKQGFDGLKIKNFSDNADWGAYKPATHYLIFDPKNIRSAYGAFDPANLDSANISHADGGKVEAPSLLERAAKATRSGMHWLADQTPLGDIHDYATHASTLLYPKETEWGGEADAMRHMLFQAELASKYGVLPAQIISTLNEYVPGITQSRAERQMDLDNDALGREIGLKESDQDMRLRAIVDLIDAEKATTVDQSKMGYAKGGPVYDAKRIEAMADSLLQMADGGAVEQPGAYEQLLEAERNQRLREATPLEQLTYEQLGMEPGLDRAAFLPIAGRGEDRQLAMPGIVYELGKSLLAPGAAARGVPVSTEDAVNLASNVMGGGLGLSSPIEGAVAGMAVKQKGGNWLTGTIEDAIRPLRQTPNRMSGELLNETAGDPLLWSRIVEQAGHYDPRTWLQANRPDIYDKLIGQEGVSINNWLDTKLAKYMRNEMATPEDPIRALAERGILHVNPEEINFRPEMYGQLTREGQQLLAQTPAAKVWEGASDNAIFSDVAGNVAEVGLAKDTPWLTKVPPETPVYALDYTGRDLGFDHLVDEMQNAMNPESGLPRNLLIDPKDLGKITVPQMVERVAKINEWRAAQMTEANLKRSQNAATVPFRTYETIPGTDQPNQRGLRWVELAAPVYTQETLPPGFKLQQWDYKGRPVWSVVDEAGITHNPAAETAEEALKSFRGSSRGVSALEDALKYEGESMGHCVGGYCPNVESGQTRIYSLRDAKGEPHVTIEVRAGNDDSNLLRQEELPQDVRENFESRGLLDPNLRWKLDENTGNYKPTIGPFEPSIVQIKGKQNRAPKDEYLPFVQDFVRGGNWSQVGDLENTGMRATQHVFSEQELQRLKRAGETDIPHILSGQEIQRLHNLIVPEGKRLIYDANGRTISGEQRSGYAEGGPVYDAARIEAMADDLLKMAQGGPVQMKDGGTRNLPLERLQDRRARAGMDAYVPARPTPSFLENVVRGGAAIPASVGRYAERVMGSDDSLAELGGDIAGVGGAMWQGLTEDPLGFAADVMPVTGEFRSAADVNTYSMLANEAAAEGNFELARMYQEIAALSATGAIPAAGILTRAAGRATKRGLVNAAQEAAKTYGRSTIRGAERRSFPGIFEDPRLMVANAEKQVAPENEVMQQLFGVNREDLYNTAMSRAPTNWLPPGAPKNPRGTAYADLLTKPANTQRLQDILSEAMESQLRPGMIGWYVMDPVYKRLLELVEPDEAARMFSDFNTLTGVHSANAKVSDELTRGSAMNWLNRQNRLDDYIQYGAKKGIPGTPADMARVPGHLAHKTAHVVPALRYLSTGKLSTEAKTPAYIAASTPPELGMNINFPVGDAHFARAIGLPDVRPLTQDPTALNVSWSMPEAMQLQQWFADDVAKRVGLSGVPGQALLWGAASPITGVKSAIGAPKLEILSDLIMKTADRLGVSPEEARDLVITGRAYAGYADGGPVSYLQHLARK